MKKKIILGAITLVVIVGAIFSLTLFNRSKNDTPQYRTEDVVRGNIEAVVVTSGTINPVTIVDVGSQVSGKISKIYVDFNSQVKEGQVLAEIDQSSFITRIKQNEANYSMAKASLEKAKVTLDNAKQKYDRALQLFEKALISYEEKENAELQYYNARADLHSAEARLEQAESQLESSRVDLGYTVIKSPIDGIVINRNINEGQTVAASFQAPVLFQIANDLSQMQVECSVDEADIGKIKEGQKVRFTVDAFPDEKFTGTVSQVRYSPEVVQNVVTYTTIVEVDNPERKLRPGMTAIVSIITGEAKNALLVPNAALRYMPSLSPEEIKKIFEDMRAKRQSNRETSVTEAKSKETGTGNQSVMPGQKSGFPIGQKISDGSVSMVWILDSNNKPRPVRVKTGVRGDDFTEIVSGRLEEGMKVITGENLSGSSRAQASSSLRRGMMILR